MGETTKIEWCDHTFNPWWGCTKVSKGCAHCYADTFSHRLGNDIWGPGKERKFFGPKKWAEPLKWNAAAQAEGRRHRVFCASMADVFEAYDTVQSPAYEGIKAARLRLFELIRTTPWLDWQLLTKRPENITASLSEAAFSPDISAECAVWLTEWLLGNPPQNVWLGYSVPNQEDADKGIPELLKVPAVARFLSCEPLIGPVSFRWAEWSPTRPRGEDGDRYNADGSAWEGESHLDGLSGIHWVIVGGESGAGARPMHPEWARELRNECAEAGVAFFFKQWGEWLPGNAADKYIHALVDSGSIQAPALMVRVGKHNAGNLLDGQVCQQIPEVSA